eukprot:scaffold15121_cov145-Amphora_coffeaeformis.AAC.3
MGRVEETISGRDGAILWHESNPRCIRNVAWVYVHRAESQPAVANMSFHRRRGINRGSVTIRLGAYETLQGNGAIRSTLNDMTKYMLAALYAPL